MQYAVDLFAVTQEDFLVRKSYSRTSDSQSVRENYGCKGVFTCTDTVTITNKFYHCGYLTGRMGSTSILPIRQTVTISTIVKLDGDSDGHGDGVVTCKLTLKRK